MTKRIEAPAESFSGTERFAVIRVLGSGGMGVVFEVEDHVRSARVALKTLLRLSATDLYRFKKEFRSLQSLVHPNLVALYELIAEDSHYFFTMELVEGTDFLTYVRRGNQNDGSGSRSVPAASQPKRGRETVGPCADTGRARSEPGDLRTTISPGTSGSTATTVTGELGPDASLPDTHPDSGRLDSPPLVDSTTIGPVEPGASGRGGTDASLGELPNPLAIGASSTVEAGRAHDAAMRPAEGRRGGCDLARLVDALAQLADGLQFLHESGMLHRDLKPSNVRVTPAGRVVILDFGLIAELDSAIQSADGDVDRRETGADSRSTAELPPDRAETDQGMIVGTIKYMAPEQAAGLALTPAADWYSLGLMMYEALTGKLPFHGTAYDILAQKRDHRLTLPEPKGPDIPTELSQLCARLLRSDPKDRPNHAEIASVLRPGRDATHPPDSVAKISTDHPFVGRELELSRLRAAYEELRKGSPAVMLVPGISGSGKTCLIQRFLDHELNPETCAILKGRCFEQESVPFKAMDSLIDSLSRYLIRRPAAWVESLVPRGVGPLMRMFPVLERVEAIALCAGAEPLPPDPLELRRRAFGGLRHLLTRLGATCPAVIWIDDLQWGDLDSAELLSEVLRGADPPRLLLLASYRSEYEQTNPCLRALLELESSVGARVAVRSLEVGPLTSDEAKQLASTLLEKLGDHETEHTASIARESAGNPYLITEIARHVLARSGVPEPGSPLDGGISLQEMIWSRIQRLPVEPRILLEVVAVGGQPVSQKSAYAASRLDVKEHAALAVLRSERLVRGSGPGIEDEIEVYHDQIREIVLDRLSTQARCECHVRLARALEAEGSADPERLAVHFAGGNEPARAAEYYRKAALYASRALAFDRAASLYRRALELAAWPWPMAGRLKGELADALANSRRGREAGLVYLEAAGEVTSRESIELRRRAFQQLLTSGEHDLGIEQLRRVFQDVGLRLAKTPTRALWLAAIGFGHLRIRGLGFRRQPLHAVDDDELLRMDVGWSAGMSLCLIDSVRAAQVLVDNLHGSLKAGEVVRVTRSLLGVAGLVAVRGTRALGRYHQLMRMAESQLEQIDDPDVLALSHMVRGLAAYAQGQWALALELNDKSAQDFRNRCTGVMTSLEMAAYYSLRALTWLGEFEELRLRRRALLKEAEERQDLFSMTNYRTEVMTYDLLASDDHALAQAEIEGAMSRWSQRGFHAQHLFALVAAVRVDLYRGNGIAARKRIQDAWRDYQGSQLHRSCIGRINVDQLIASSALAAWGDHADKGSLCKEVTAATRRLDRERIAYAQALALMLRGRLAGLRGDGASAVRFYRDAFDRFERLQMPLYRAATGFRLAELLEGVEGRDLTHGAIGWLESQTVRNPDAMIRMVLP